jgi:hypothetical protein
VSAAAGADVSGPLELALDDGTRLEIDPARGGRVTGLWVAGRNLLTGADVDPVNFGSTFWTSPQSLWGWPPVPEIDVAPYDVVPADAGVALRGPKSPALGVSVGKRFAVDRARRAFRLGFDMHSEVATELRLAPWQVTRVRPGGLTFFATGVGTLAHSDLPVRAEGVVTWLHHDAAVIAGHQKVFADTPETWLAHVDGDVLFVKTFETVPPEAHAPGEAQIEIYASTAHRYLELEVQGAHEAIAPGAVRSWTVTWHARRLPAGVARELGSAALVELARGVAAGQE